MFHEEATTQAPDAPMFVQWLDAPQEWVALGGKAGPLATLLAAGLPVPPGFAVGPAAFRNAPLRDSNGAASLLEPHAIEEIRRAYGILAQRLGEADPAVAVRSSAAAEDLPGASFAGQYQSFLHVRGEADVLTYITRCWSSLHAEHVRAYRRDQEQRAGVALPPAMTVLVQSLVEAEAAGVAFTAHPATGDTTCVVVNAGWGLGQSIVDGEVEADTYRVDRQTLALLEQRVGHKATRTGAGPEASRETVPEHQQQTPCLTAEQAAAVARLALRAEAIIGRPVDVEWALQAHTVWLLQARPITALPATPAPTPPGETAQPAASTPTTPAPAPIDATANSQVGPSALFPFTWPDAQAPAVHWQLYSIDQRRTEAIRPLEQDVRATFSGTFERAAVICGRPRYQRTWYVNGFEYTAEVENPRPEVDQALCREALEQTAAALAERGEAYNRTVWFPAIDAGNARLAVVDVDALALPDLAAHLEETLQWYERLWTWHWIWPQDGPARRFKQFYKQHFGQPVTGQVAASEQALDAEAQELLTYEPNLLTQAIDGLIELAGTIQQHEALRNLFETHAAASALEALPRTAGGDVLRAQLDRLLETQGLRCGAGFGTERNQLLPGWREQPALVLEMVQKYVPQDLTRLLQARLAATAERDRRAAALQARLPDESARAAFTFWLTAARRQQQAFEDHNYKIDSATSSLLHRAVAACARRLMTAGVLADPDDVWWLHAPDIALALRGLAGDASAESPEAGRAHWSALIAARKAQHAWRQQLTPPPVLGKLNSAPLAQAAPPTEAPAQPPNLLLNGEPGSTGVATGRVRLVSRDILVPDVVAGDVLVAHNAGPLWTPLFPVVAAVILDQGVLFQHAMLTCREYGVPAVFQTKDATQQLREGQRVTVDGTHGWVLAAEA